jgi:RNA recognition motif-containing protein
MNPMQMMGAPWGIMPMKTTTFAPPLYVGDLDDTVHEEFLYDIFSKYGPLHFVRIMRDSGTGKSRGYAFVNFVNPRDAETAKQHAQYEKVGRKHIRIMFKRNVRDMPQDANVFVKNIDPNATVKDLHEHFAKTEGNIISCKVNTDHEGKNLGYGYVQYDKAEDALELITSDLKLKVLEEEVGLRDARRILFAEFSLSFDLGLVPVDVEGFSGTFKRSLVGFQISVSLLSRVLILEADEG